MKQVECKPVQFVFTGSFKRELVAAGHYARLLNQIIKEVGQMIETRRMAGQSHFFLSGDMTVTVVMQMILQRNHDGWRDISIEIIDTIIADAEVVDCRQLYLDNISDLCCGNG